MTRMKSGSRAALSGVSVLAAALAVELVDELVDGSQGAAFPLIRHDLGLSYAHIGLLASVPLLLGGALELPSACWPGMADGGGWRCWPAGWCSSPRW